MKPEPRKASDYDDRTTQAIKSALLELGQILGDYLEDLVIIGGAVPWLLLTNSEQPHIGTIDIDLALNPSGLKNAQRYAALVRLLEQSGYERQLDGLQLFQLRKMIRVDDDEPIAVTLDLLKPSKPKTKGSRPPLIPNFRVVDADGAEFAFKQPERITLEGIMPDGRNNRVVLPVADLPSFLVMKGYALKKRDKPKDAYDVYYVVKHYPDGLAALAELCRPLLADPAARAGFAVIAEKFDGLNSYGADTVRDFLREMLGSSEEIDLLHRDAFRQVNAWVRALDLSD
jgi:hypothetical protein